MVMLPFKAPKVTREQHEHVMTNVDAGSLRKAAIRFSMK